VKSSEKRKGENCSARRLYTSLWSLFTQWNGRPCSPCLSVHRWNSEFNWIRSNRLPTQRNQDWIWCATPRRLPLLPVTPIRVSSEIISPSSSVHDLGVYIDADMLVRTHVAKIAASCELRAALNQIQSVRRSLPPSAMKMMVVSLVLSRLDGRQRDFDRHSAYLLRCLPPMLNAAVQLGSSLFCRLSTHQCDACHWLRTA